MAWRVSGLATGQFSAIDASPRLFLAGMGKAGVESQLPSLLGNNGRRLEHLREYVSMGLW